MAASLFYRQDSIKKGTQGSNPIMNDLFQAETWPTSCHTPETGGCEGDIQNGAGFNGSNQLDSFTECRI